MKTIYKVLFSVLFAPLLLASCARQQAYFQPTARESFKTAPAVAVAQPVEIAPPAETVSVTPQPAPAVQLAQAKQAISEVEAYVRNDSKLASNKKLTKRMTRLNELMTTSVEKTASETDVASTKKMNLMQRFMLKKMNKKISHQLAPANPEKAMAVKGILALGAVILIAGLLLVLLTTGTGATIGVIGIIAGLALLLIGLI